MPKNVTEILEIIEPPQLIAFYSHISRLYTSRFSSLTATIFGWLAYNGLIINLKSTNTFGTYRLPLILLGIGITGFAFYFFWRLLLFGRWMYKLENQLLSKEFLEDLPDLSPFRSMNERKDVKSWTLAEILSIPILLALFLIPLFFYYFIP
ncbi:hypothetical protein A3K70_00185 [Candidatus Bathyarchaeota archaeon RBG_16_48_13]|nr:MAG: hypothetical protein A3K70_00185 [Candidatus Bathyarchaeota archaeon RBG_16_48_13]